MKKPLEGWRPIRLDQILTRPEMDKTFDIITAHKSRTAAHQGLVAYLQTLEPRIKQAGILPEYLAWVLICMFIETVAEHMQAPETGANN